MKALLLGPVRCTVRVRTQQSCEPKVISKRVQGWAIGKAWWLTGSCLRFLRHSVLSGNPMVPVP